MSIQVIVTVTVIFGGMSLVLLACFVYASIKRNAIVRLEQKKSREIKKILKGSEGVS